MGMNQKTIETLSVNAVRDSIVISKFLDQYIPDNDKEPFWDGAVYVSETLDYYKDKISKKISKLENSIKKENKEQKIDKLNSKLQQFKEMYNGMFNGGLDND